MQKKEQVLAKKNEFTMEWYIIKRNKFKINTGTK